MTSGTTVPHPDLAAGRSSKTVPCESGLYDTNLWFPEGNNPQAHADADRASTLCMTCPLQVPCRDYALATRPYGIWGGLTEANRDTIRKGGRLRDRKARWLAGQTDYDGNPAATAPAA